jgi:hypothetical protein
MNAPLKLFLLMAAMAMFAIACFWMPPRFNLIAGGLFCLTASMVVP